MSMTQMEKQKLAERLVDLTMKDRFPGPLAEGATEARKEMRQRRGDKFMQLWAEIYAKHYADEQLLAILNFYESDIGRSILDTRPALTAEFNSRIAELSSSSVSHGLDDPKWTLYGISGIKPSDEDT